jgi:ABC-type multidrug transport system permease subunit
MSKLLALIGARNKEFYRDRAALIWTLLFPFIVLAGFTYGYSGRQEPLLRVRVAPASAVVEPALRDLVAVPGVELKETDDEAAALAKLARYELDLVVTVADGGRRLRYALNADSDKGKLAERLLRDAAGRQAPPPALETRTVAGRRIRYADWLLPGLLAMNIMFGSMFGVGYVVVRYRKNGVLKRLRATPLSAFQFLTAQVLSRMLVTLVTSFMVLGGAMVLIGFRPQGSWLDLAVFLCVCATSMISLGLVVAARIATEEVAEGLLNLMTWPMIFLSGIWFSLEGASPWVLRGAKLMPLTHVVDGLRAILIEGVGLGQLVPQLAVLAGLSVVFLAIGAAIFRWR